MTKERKKEFKIEKQFTRWKSSQQWCQIKNLIFFSHHQLIQFGMRPQSKASHHKQLFTNSIIHIKSNLPPSELLYHWQRLPPNSSHPLLNIHSIIPTSQQYVCTPLDYNCMIDMTVEYQNEKQNFRYGPIKLEKQLIKRFEFEKIRQKHCIYHGFLLKNKVRTSVSITLQAGQIKIFSPENQILAQTTALQTKQSPNIMKIQNQNNSYGLLLYVSRIDDYMNLQFEERLERDQLICQVMQVNGITINELVKNNEKLFASNNSFQTTALLTSGNFGNLKNSNLFIKPCKKQEKSLKNLTTLESDINELIQSEEQAPPDQIIQDIYDILYTPSASKNISSQRKQIKRDYAEDDDHCNFQLVKTLKHNEYLNLLSSCYSIQGEVNEGAKQKCGVKVRTVEDQQGQHKIKKQIKTPMKVIKTKKQVNYELGGTPKTSYIFDETSPNISINSKITNLNEANTKLMEENERLKNENKKLKLNQQKKEKLEFAKIKQIRTMIANMAGRIAYLQGFNDANHSQLKNEDNIVNQNTSPRKENPQLGIIKKPKTSRFLPNQHVRKMKKQLSPDTTSKQFFKKQAKNEEKDFKKILQLSPRVPQKVQANEQQKTLIKEKQQEKQKNANIMFDPQKKQLVLKPSKNSLKNRYFSPNFFPPPKN